MLLDKKSRARAREENKYKVKRNESCEKSKGSIIRQTLIAVNQIHFALASSKATWPKSVDDQENVKVLC